MSGSSMIERVARAICVARGVDPDDQNWAINNFRDDGGPEPDVCCPAWHWYRDSARSAILAMREPTRAMKDAAYSIYADRESPSGQTYYTAMIDAALKEG